MATLQSSGKMFGLTFWENWYILGEMGVGLPRPAEQFGIGSAYADMREMVEKGSTDNLKLVFYTGHTLQGSYKGAFVYSTSPTMTPQTARAAMKLISQSGLNPYDFCVIRNTCFKRTNADVVDNDSSNGAGPDKKGLKILDRVRREKQLYRMQVGIRGCSSITL